MACASDKGCDYYVHKPDEALFTCFIGDLHTKSPMKSPLNGLVDVHLKDPSSSTNDAFTSCQTMSMRPASTAEMVIPTGKESKEFQYTIQPLKVTK